MVIAAEAFHELSPAAKAQAFETLKAHPDFAKWTNAYHPNPRFDLATYVFMRSSTWPDEIRKTDNEYDHPEWHFIDYPLRPPHFVFEPDARPTNNVLFGIQQSEQTLGDTNAMPQARAAAMSWLVHLIGDLHQPLHAESLFTETYTNGDRGGNDFFVKPAQFGIRLHAFWDGLLGTSASLATQWKYAATLENEFPRSSLPELTTDLTPQSWSLESRTLAINQAYLQGDLKGGTDADAAPSLPDGYPKNAKAVAERQGALAGFRLADEIQKYLKFNGEVPLLPENTNALVETEIKKISALEAKKYYDETMIVTGKVVNVSRRPNITILDIDQPYPNAPLTAVIFQENVGQFGDLQKFRNQAVEITGTITEYHNKPEIILESTNQLKAVEPK